jgi:hypothetical protein
VLLGLVCCSLSHLCCLFVCLFLPFRTAPAPNRIGARPATQLHAAAAAAAKRQPPLLLQVLPQPLLLRVLPQPLLLLLLRYLPRRPLLLPALHLQRRQRRSTCRATSAARSLWYETVSCVAFAIFVLIVALLADRRNCLKILSARLTDTRTNAQRSCSGGCAIRLRRLPW